MDITCLPDNPYLLLTPGPLSTTKSVKAAMLRDWCTWDDDYKELVQEVRTKLIRLATNKTDNYTCVLMQGSGTFAVESIISTALPDNGKLLVLPNGAYGDRIVQIAKTLKIDCVFNDSGELEPPDLEKLEATLKEDGAITHVAVVHSETTTGMLNPIEKIGKIVKKHGKIFIVDAMSSFGGIPIDIEAMDVDFIVSSANKCIQGVPGFGFIIAKKETLLKCKGQARSLSLDLYDQWNTMENDKGKWRYTSPDTCGPRLPSGDDRTGGGGRNRQADGTVPDQSPYPGRRDEKTGIPDAPAGRLPGALHHLILQPGERQIRFQDLL